MYIGTTGPEGLHHLVYEVVDNSIDEALAGFCKEISVAIHADGSVTVTDDGRGIPVDLHPTEGKHRRRGRDDPPPRRRQVQRGDLQGLGRTPRRRRLGRERALRVARARDQARRQGLAAALPARRARGARSRRSAPPSATGTKVTFKPDPEIFPTTDFSFDVLSQRLRELSFLNAGIRIRIEDERNDKLPRLLLRGRHRLLRRAPEPEQARRSTRPRSSSPASATSRAARRRGAGLDRGRDPVQRDLQRERLLRSPTTSTRSRAART